MSEERATRCTVCGRRGHNARSCGQTDEERAAKRQRNGRPTRRTFSMNRGVFERFQAWARANGTTMGAQLEKLLAGDLSEWAQKTRARRAWDTRSIGPMYSHPIRPPRVVRAVPVAEVEVVDAVVEAGSERSLRPVAIAWPRAVIELLEDSLRRPVTHGQPAHCDDLLSSVLDAALVRMLDAYDEIASRASHCAVCRSRVKPFSPRLAGESVVAVCRECVREKRRLDGRRVA